MGILNARSATIRLNVAKEWLWILSKIGIFSGTFDPIHAGHIAFALKALEMAKLDEVYLIPEMVPRRKDGVTHYAHRIAMIKLALKPYKNIKLLELPDKQLSVQKTLPRLKKMFAGDELFMLVGSDMVDFMISPNAVEQWPDLNKFLEAFKLIVAVRGKRIKEEHRQKIDRLQSNALAFASQKPLISSRNIRESLMRGRMHKDVLPSLRDYIKKNWLYASPGAAEPNIS
jgi:nicotinate-nucleotide adenylyltransferase